MLYLSVYKKQAQDEVLLRHSNRDNVLVKGLDGSGHAHGSVGILKRTCTTRDCPRLGPRNARGEILTRGGKAAANTRAEEAVKNVVLLLAVLQVLILVVSTHRRAAARAVTNIRARGDANIDELSADNGLNAALILTRPTATCKIIHLIQRKGVDSGRSVRQEDERQDANDENDDYFHLVPKKQGLTRKKRTAHCWGISITDVLSLFTKRKSRLQHNSCFIWKPHVTFLSSVVIHDPP